MTCRVWDPLLRRWVEPVPVQPPEDLADWLRELAAYEDDTTSEPVRKDKP